MIDKVDLVMWTKNGAKTLPNVLRRINECIPWETVNTRIMVDDSSLDNTRELGEQFGWNVVPNKGAGISDGANTALSLVKTEFFASFEQDILLAKDWWPKVLRHFKDANVVAVTGLRYSDRPLYWRRFQKFVARRYRGKAVWLSSTRGDGTTFGVGLDNTLWRTAAIRELGGFPTLQSNTGIDSLLAYKIRKAGKKWVIEYDTESTHIRLGGMRQEIQHQEWYASGVREIQAKIVSETGFKSPLSTGKIVYRFLTSPFAGVFLGLKVRDMRVAVLYPIVRGAYLKGYLHGNLR